MKAKATAQEMSEKVQVSELRWVKGFGEKTIATLLENGITTVDGLKSLSEEEAYKFLTPVQYHQINRYIKENNL